MYADTGRYWSGAVCVCEYRECLPRKMDAECGQGFAIAPLVLAPLSEEFGRKWTYITAVAIYATFHLMMALYVSIGSPRDSTDRGGRSKNISAIIVARLILGCSGSIGATLVGGTISDIYVPDEYVFRNEMRCALADEGWKSSRGSPMSAFAFAAFLGVGLGPVTMSFVVAAPNLGWRWVWWIQLSEYNIVSSH